MNTTTPSAFDTMTAAFAMLFATSAARWTVEGWAAHIRAARHPLHAINSFVKHAGEFDAVTWPAVLAVTVARCVDGGMPAETALAEIRQRRERRLGAVPQELSA